MKYLKRFENIDDRDEILYSEGDIVVFTKKYDEHYDINYVGYIDQDGEHIYEYDKRYPKYCKKYKVLKVYCCGRYYKSVTRFGISVYKVDVEDIETGNIFACENSNEFTLESSWTTPDEPMIGDYVLCKVDFKSFSIPDEKLNNFINHTVGRCVGYEFLKNRYTIEYRGVTSKLSIYFWNRTNPYIKDFGHKNMNLENIIYYSTNKKDVEDKLELLKNADKYNL